VTATHHPASGVQGATPELRFSVEGAASVPHAAVPTLAFALRIAAAPGVAIRSVLLDVQIQIAARQRSYDAAAEEQLLEVFGVPDQWASTLRTLSWTWATVVAPAFSDATVVDLHVPCSYDLEVTASRYFAALRDGEVPLEFLFSGSVFFAAANGMLQAARISLDTDVDFRLPVAIWREAIDRHFPGSSWLRLGRQTMERLTAYKARAAYTSWDAAIASLLQEGESR
jgi:hypothetical protein